MRWGRKPHISLFWSMEAPSNTQGWMSLPVPTAPGCAGGRPAVALPLPLPCPAHSKTTRTSPDSFDRSENAHPCTLILVINRMSKLKFQTGLLACVFLNTTLLRIKANLPDYIFFCGFFSEHKYSVWRSSIEVYIKIYKQSTK